MLIDEPDDMKAVRHDLGMGELFSDQCTIGGGKIDAHDANAFFALQSFEKGLQSGLRADWNDIIDGVVLQVAKGGGKAFAAGKEMLVNDQYRRATQRMPFGELTFQTVPKVSVYGGRPMPSRRPNTTAIDAIQVLTENRLPVRFRGPLTAQHTWSGCRNCCPHPKYSHLRARTSKRQCRSPRSS